MGASACRSAGNEAAGKGSPSVGAGGRWGRMSVLGELGSLVGWERGRISPAIYFDEEVYRREQARVFAGGWVPVGHEDMVRRPGDYVTNYMGEVPVIVLRDRGGVVRVLVNK